MSFGKDSIDKMFEDAADAAENTGEKDVGLYSSKPKVSEPVKVEAKEPVATVKPEPIKPEVKPEPVRKAEPIKKPDPIVKPEPVKKKEVHVPQEKKAIVPDRPAGGIIGTEKGINEESIGRILKMNKTFEDFDSTQKEFVSGYFQVEEDTNDVSVVIHRALVASQRDLAALSQIVVAKGHKPAERAFFLMGLDSYEIKDIYEQVDLLTGDLGDPEHITDSNKLQICRDIERVVDGMPKDVFTYIEKLQVFTNQAIPK